MKCCSASACSASVLHEYEVVAAAGQELGEQRQPGNIATSQSRPACDSSLAWQPTVAAASLRFAGRSRGRDSD
jgi:hypothetical protein